MSIKFILICAIIAGICSYMICSVTNEIKGGMNNFETYLEKKIEHMEDEIDNNYIDILGIGLD